MNIEIKYNSVLCARKRKVIVTFNEQKKSKLDQIIRISDSKNISKKKYTGKTLGRWYFMHNTEKENISK